MAISLCGFANISSMGICISGISALCPDKRKVLSKLAFKAMIGGFAVKCVKFNGSWINNTILKLIYLGSDRYEKIQ